MNNNSCEFVRELLVDYDDGQLQRDQATEVAEHLSACPLCREELDALRDSLRQAREIWEVAAAAIEDIRIGGAARKRRIVLKRLAAVAACVVLAVGVTLLTWTARTPKSPEPTEVAGISPAARAIRLMEREAASAKLGVSAQILSEQPGGQEFAVGAFQYLAQTYPETAMGKEALAKIGSN